MSQAGVAEKIRLRSSSRQACELDDAERAELQALLTQLLAATLSVDASAIKPTDVFEDDLGVDSIILLQYFDSIKRELQIQVPTGELFGFLVRRNVQGSDLCVARLGSIVLDFVNSKAQATEASA